MNLRETDVRELFRGKKIAVIGDIVADQFLSGNISRVSREAPVFILKHRETETRPGAAANAAANIASLGAVPILVGAVGDDPAGRELRAALELITVRLDSVLIDHSRKTTTKVRVHAGQLYAAKQQVIRIDYENDAAPSGDVQSSILTSALASVTASDAVIISDYGYGTASKDLISAVKERAAERGIPIIADSRSGLRNFAEFTSATPNQEEAEELLGRAFSPEDGDALRSSLGLDSLLVTLGGKGMCLFESERPFLKFKAIGSDQPVDVTGAGDTVIAVFALGLASGLSPSHAASIANHAGGIVVMKRGTAVVAIDELESSIASYSNAHFEAANES